MSSINTVAVFAASERLDTTNVNDFKGKTLALLTGHRVLIIDLSRTAFIDSAGLGSLVSLLKSCANSGTRLIMASPTPQVRQIFELTRLYRLFDIFETVNLAQASLTTP